MIRIRFTQFSPSLIDFVGFEYISISFYNECGDSFGLLGYLTGDIATDIIFSYAE